MNRDDRKILKEYEDIRIIFANIANNIETQLRENTIAIGILSEKVKEQMALLDDLAREVQENTDVVQSVITLVTGLRDKVLALQAAAQAAGDSPETIAKIHELAAQLDANSNTLAALTVDNTPVPNPEPAPAPEPTVPATPEEPAAVEPAPAPEAEPAAPVDVEAPVAGETTGELPPAEPTP
jgi:hypothetical protein